MICEVPSPLAFFEYFFYDAQQRENVISKLFYLHIFLLFYSFFFLIIELCRPSLSSRYANIASKTCKCMQSYQIISWSGKDLKLDGSHVSLHRPSLAG